MHTEKPSESRNRLALSLPDGLDTVLEDISGVLGVPKTSLAIQAIIAALPGWIEQTATIRKAVKTSPRPKGR